MKGYHPICKAQTLKIYFVVNIHCHVF